MPKNQKLAKSPKYAIQTYSVVAFQDDCDTEKLFECIPDRWFVDESKTRCYWPPTTGKSYTVRAINCEKPDDSWSIYEVKVISEGHCKLIFINL